MSIALHLVVVFDDEPGEKIVPLLEAGEQVRILAGEPQYRFTAKIEQVGVEKRLDR